jgi:hypothetical protein
MGGGESKRDLGSSGVRSPGFRNRISMWRMFIFCDVMIENG